VVPSGNAANDSGSRIRENSGLFQYYPKSHDFGYSCYRVFHGERNPNGVARWGCRLFLTRTLVGQRHFRVEYKHEAQASEYFTPKRTRLRCVLVFSQIDTKVALSNYWSSQIPNPTCSSN